MDRTAANDNARVALELFVESIDVEGLFIGDATTNVDNHVATLNIINKCSVIDLTSMFVVELNNKCEYSDQPVRVHSSIR